MPPPSSCSRISTRSTGDHDFNNCNSSDSSDDESKTQIGYDSVGLVKSFLGPSFEDAVLRTLEFGKSLIQKTEEDFYKEKNQQSECKKDDKDSQNQLNVEMLLKEGCEDQEIKMDRREYSEGRPTRKRIVFTAKLDKDLSLLNKPVSSPKKLINVSKIRSLDSDLKQVAPSPEKIKRQLEALIQINKDEPPEHASWNFPPKKQFVEMTVMPSFCTYTNDTECPPPSPPRCDVQSPMNRRDDPCFTEERTPRRRLGAPSGICQAPELITSALGPTLDVAIIDNLKMIRDLFKSESGKGEGTEKSGEGECVCPSVKSEDDIQSRIQQLLQKVKELELKEKCLQQQIENEEHERECRRKAFEEEERKMCSLKAELECLMDDSTKKGCGKPSASDLKDLEIKRETLKQRILCEEEKLSRLKDQYECYKRELAEVKTKKDSMKRNKSLLDAWDVIASRVCHTRLPSFSRACNLERKQLGGSSPGDVHCCLFPQGTDEGPPPSGRKSSSRTRCGSKSRSDICCSKSKESQSNVKCCKSKTGDIPFPIQRDITCGLHQSLKTCTCSQNVKPEGAGGSSDDELIKKCAAKKGKAVCRSRSEAAMRKDKCSKVVKVMWAVTRINIFQDNCRTYEVMDATSTPPACPPVRTEGIFVVKNPKKKLCSPRRRL